MNINSNGRIQSYPSSSAPQTETTVVEEEEYDAEGKLVRKTKTTTTRTISGGSQWQYPYVTH